MSAEDWTDAAMITIIMIIGIAIFWCTTVELFCL